MWIRQAQDTAGGQHCGEFRHAAGRDGELQTVAHAMLQMGEGPRLRDAAADFGTISFQDDLEIARIVRGVALRIESAEFGVDHGGTLSASHAHKQI